jgi:hypothetical protein
MAVAPAILEKTGHWNKARLTAGLVLRAVINTSGASGSRHSHAASRTG